VGPSDVPRRQEDVRAPVDWEKVGELMDMSYRNVALKRMLKALDDA
jgi:hypothetical protein